MQSQGCDGHRIRRTLQACGTWYDYNNLTCNPISFLSLVGVGRQNVTALNRDVGIVQLKGSR